MHCIVNRLIVTCIIVSVLLQLHMLIGNAFAYDFVLPKPGQRVQLSAPFNPAILVGLQVNPKDPFQLNFIFDRGEQSTATESQQQQFQYMIESFMTSLAIPNQDMWVNLSPYEKERIIPDNFSATLMGKELLAQDYLLKQMSSSLMYPEDDLGKAFWKRVYEESATKHGGHLLNVPISTFNKVWIVPDKADVYEKGDTVYIAHSHLKVMLEQDYLAQQKNDKWSPSKSSIGGPGKAISGFPIQTLGNDSESISSQIIREVIIPELEREINQGKNFAKLRQAYSAMLLATWFKKSLRKSILGATYVDQAKIEGLSNNEYINKEKIYEDYLKAFKIGAFNFIKEEIDPQTRVSVPRKYFAGGIKPYDEAMIQTTLQEPNVIKLGENLVSAQVVLQILNAPVFSTGEERERYSGEHGIESIDDFDIKNPELGWIPLTDHIRIRFIDRDDKPFASFLTHQEIQHNGNDTIYAYQLPKDITVSEVIQIIHDLQNLPYPKRIRDCSVELPGEIDCDLPRDK